MKKIFYWLSIPYYFNPSLKFKFQVSIFMGAFVFLFLYLFRPFYISLFVGLELEYTAFIGIITFLAVLFVLTIPPLLFKDYFNEDNWTIGRNLFLIKIGLFINGSSLWYLGNLYRSYYGFGSIGYFRYLFFVYLLGTFPVILFTFFNERNVRDKRKKRAEKINTLKKYQVKEEKIVTEESIIIYSENKKENISFKIQDLVYVTSQGNYASFFLLTEYKKDLKEIILRITLTKINEILESYNNVIRCHRSYIVNTYFINSISGNARGYFLKSNKILIEIPVSRNFKKEELEKLIH
ncbi:LytR/AlgR family response regulator transcription factor [Polaribacter sargassicola]|uniref:LytR/AlgR family response regulator transcription factor n=1 Tax=Polaribacter sargassicola TaxID=2836891 RepID=UPI001F219672|nr:LytTR family DNA-binding domain-containing protein [Polaribacter sp. DS7-9]MCG1035085.1 LytTR family transcriptional regulator [Polaribacter sp. DS7-9]